MTVQGIVQNGVVVLKGGAGLPEGTEVTVVVEATSTMVKSSQAQRLTEEELRRRKAIFDQITSLPDENPGDTFSGRDHDKVLYGEP